MLGVSILKHEDAESFVWVFRQFTCVMLAPNVVFTDEDAAMAVVIRAHKFTHFYLGGSHRLWKRASVLRVS